MALSFDDMKRMAKDQGWALHKGRGGHWKFVSPEGAIVTTADTPSDRRRALKNILGELRRAGFVDDPGRVKRPRPWAHAQLPKFFTKDKLYIRSELDDIESWARDQGGRIPDMIVSTYRKHVRGITVQGEEFIRATRKPMSDRAYSGAKGRFIEVVEDAEDRFMVLSRVLLDSGEEDYELVGQMLLESANRLRTLMGRLRSES